MRHAIMTALFAACLTPVAEAAKEPSKKHALEDIKGAIYSFDRRSKLAWLDMEQTMSLSYRDVMAGAEGWIHSGWRYATADEVNRLFRVNLPSIESQLTWDGNSSHYKGAFYAPYGPDHNGEIRRFIEVLNPFRNDFFNGVYDKRLPGLNDGVYMAQVYSDGSNGLAWTSSGMFDWDSRYDTSHFLVKRLSGSEIPPIPEPPMYALLLSGMGLVWLIGRRRYLS